MWIEQYLLDEQDPKTAEKVLTKLRDMLTSGEVIIYFAIQKKPAVTLIPDCIAVTNKRLVFCIPGNLGLTTNFITLIWEEVKEVLFKEEFFGAKFIAVPQKAENISIDYIPKVQARKLYQFCNEQIERYKDSIRNQETEARKALVPQSVSETIESDTSTIPAQNDTKDDELTQKLVKLKNLFEKQLITQGEYENKKAEILSQL